MYNKVTNTSNKEIKMSNHTTLEFFGVKWNKYGVNWSGTTIVRIWLAFMEIDRSDLIQPGDTIFK